MPLRPSDRSCPTSRVRALPSPSFSFHRNPVGQALWGPTAQRSRGQAQAVGLSQASFSAYGSLAAHSSGQQHWQEHLACGDTATDCWKIPAMFPGPPLQGWPGSGRWSPPPLQGWPGSGCPHCRVDQAPGPENRVTLSKQQTSQLCFLPESPPSPVLTPPGCSLPSLTTPSQPSP